MSFTEDGITDLRTTEFDGGLIVRARSAHADRVVQCYVAGRLADWQTAPGEDVRFELAGVEETDLIALLAVDPTDAETDWWASAFGASDAHGSRVRLRTPQTIAPYRPADRWRVYLGDAGDEQADALLWDQAVYPAAARACGWGAALGEGGFGWDGRDAAGFGLAFGRGEFGFDCEMLEVVSDPLGPGTYPYRAVVADEAGNVSAATAGEVTLDTFAGCAAALTVQSYDRATDALRLAFAPSKDLS